MHDLLLQCVYSESKDDIYRWSKIGFRFGDKGTHTSRTIMLDELKAVLEHCPSGSPRAAYSTEIIDHNLLGKRTASTRRLTNQRLGELYGLAPSVPVYRLMRYFWEADDQGRPLLALLTAIARDPLLRATTDLVMALQPGQELVKTDMLTNLRDFVGDRLNDSTLDKVARNISSSWTQSGHLEGRVRKKRQPVLPTPYVTSYALVLAYLLGIRGQGLFESPFAKVIDTSPDELVYLAMDAKRLGILEMQNAGGMLNISFDALLSEEERSLAHGTD